MQSYKKQYTAATNKDTINHITHYALTLTPGPSPRGDGCPSLGSNAIAFSSFRLSRVTSFCNTLLSESLQCCTSTALSVTSLLIWMLVGVLYQRAVAAPCRGNLKWKHFAFKLPLQGAGVLCLVYLVKCEVRTISAGLNCLFVYLAGWI